MAQVVRVMGLIGAESESLDGDVVDRMYDVIQNLRKRPMMMR